MNQEERTTSLLEELKAVDMKHGFTIYHANHVNDVHHKNFPDFFCAYLNQHPDLTVKEIIHNSELDENYARQVINGTRHGSKYKIIAICIAAHMKIKEVQRALKLSGNTPLYPKTDRDAAIIICINNECYNIVRINEFLNERGLEILK
ncbi:MAG: hypothetical protein PHW34_03840 [Hespellia sp.]|nr:hypothetical protein [Hespellia sp.]